MAELILDVSHRRPRLKLEAGVSMPKVMKSNLAQACLFQASPMMPFGKCVQIHCPSSFHRLSVAVKHPIWNVVEAFPQPVLLTSLLQSCQCFRKLIGHIYASNLACLGVLDAPDRDISTHD